MIIFHHIGTPNQPDNPLDLPNDENWNKAIDVNMKHDHVWPDYSEYSPDTWRFLLVHARYVPKNDLAIHLVHSVCSEREINHEAAVDCLVKALRIEL